MLVKGATGIEGWLIIFAITKKIHRPIHIICNKYIILSSTPTYDFLMILMITWAVIFSTKWKVWLVIFLLPHHQMKCIIHTHGDSLDGIMGSIPGTPSGNAKERLIMLLNRISEGHVRMTYHTYIQPTKNDGIWLQGVFRLKHTIRFGSRYIDKQTWWILKFCTILYYRTFNMIHNQDARFYK